MEFGAREYRRLADCALKGELLLFLGAGVSCGPRGLPAGRQLARELLGAAGLNVEATDSLPFAASLVAAERGRPFLVAWLRERLGRVTEPTLAHRALAGLPVQTIVTTNYDLLVENALRQAGVAFQRVCTVADVLKLSSSARVLFKIHGSLDVDEAEAPLVVTEEDFFEHFLLAESVAFDVLKAWFLTKVCVFVGFALSDPNFLHLFYLIRRLLKEHAPAAAGKFLAVQVAPRQEQARVWRKRGFEVVDCTAEVFLDRLGAAVDFHTTEQESGTRALKFLPGTPVRPLAQKLLNALAEGYGQHHRVVVVSDRKLAFLRGDGFTDPLWCRLERQADGCTYSENVLAHSRPLSLIPGFGVPRQIRTVLRLNLKRLDLEREPLRLAPCEPAPAAVLEVRPHEHIGVPALAANTELLNRLPEELRPACEAALRNRAYLQLRPLELGRLQLRPGEAVELRYEGRAATGLLAVPRTDDNRCAAYIPQKLCQELGLRDPRSGAVTLHSRRGAAKLFGILARRDDDPVRPFSGQTTFFADIACVAQEQGGELAVFDLAEAAKPYGPVKGLRFEVQERRWRETTEYLPYALYDRYFSEAEEIELHKHRRAALAGMHRLFNPPLARVMMDKWRCGELVRQAGFRVPETALVEDLDGVRSVVAAGDAWVLKPRRGMKGQGIRFLCRHGENLTFMDSRAPAELECLPAAFPDYLIQRYVASLRTPSGHEVCLRALVQMEDDGPKMVGVYLRANEAFKPSNLASGGSVVALEELASAADCPGVRQAEIEACAVGIFEAARRHMAGLFEAGVDLIPAADGLHFIEANSKPARLGLKLLERDARQPDAVRDANRAARRRSLLNIVAYAMREGSPATSGPGRGI